MQIAVRVVARVAMSARLVWALVLAMPAAAVAQQTPPDESGTLSDYYRALAERRLIAPETGSDTRLRELVLAGERAYLDERWDEAQRYLYEAVESPRFTDFAELEEYRSAEWMLAGALQRMGALRSAWRYLERILARGPSDSYYGPAYRRAVDVALSGADLAESAQRLSALGEEGIPAESLNELRYLRGRERYDAHDWDGAAAQLEQIDRESRFYANARYLLGTIAAQAGRLSDAEGHFCSIATTAETDSFTFFIDRRYFELRDLTWMALGRVAHEGRRADDAFYYYFQVPQDSARVAEALFEAGWAMYEGDQHDEALDLLDQLEARFPDSPYVHEASLLRGYIHLARCDFEDADRLFRQFQVRFTPVVHEIDAILENPARQEHLFEELLAAEASRQTATAPAEGQAPGEGGAALVDVQALLLSLLRVDPAFYRLNAEIQTLDAEAARAGRVAEDLGAIAARLRGDETPRAAAEQVTELDEITALERDLAGARAILRALTDQLDAMRREGARRDQVRPLETELAGLGRRVAQLEALVRRTRAGAVSPPPGAAGGDLEAILGRDRALAARFPSRVADVRHRMVTAANDAAVAALRHLRGSLGAYLRRSRIGRIDAVMGSKRRIEIQIESLAAGRFPPELQDPLAIQGLLRDDEEYWPFEGEYWADEFEEDPASGADDLDEAAEEAALDEEPAEGDAPSEGAPAPDPAAPSAESP